MSDHSLLSNSIEARDSNSLIHPLTNLKTHLEKKALVIKEGDGVWVTDVHGNKYIEGMSGQTPSPSCITKAFFSK